MVAMIARQLKQPIDHIEEWDGDKLFFYFDRACELVEMEVPASDKVQSSQTRRGV